MEDFPAWDFIPGMFLAGTGRWEKYLISAKSNIVAAFVEAKALFTGSYLFFAKRFNHYLAGLWDCRSTCPGTLPVKNGSYNSGDTEIISVDLVCLYWYGLWYYLPVQEQQHVKNSTLVLIFDARLTIVYRLLANGILLSYFIQ